MANFTHLSSCTSNLSSMTYEQQYTTRIRRFARQKPFEKQLSILKFPIGEPSFQWKSEVIFHL